MNENKIGLLALARYGDIINALPIAKYFATQAPVDWIIADEFKGILDGISYATAVVPEGLSGCQDSVAAMSWAAARYPRLINAQVYNNPNMSRTRLANFLEEQYYLAGVSWLLGKEAPVFDRRNAERERLWLQQFDMSKPIVAYNLAGVSTPMGSADLLDRALNSRFGDRCTLVNTSQVKPERIYDLLGLFDIAKVLVTIDTATTHLSRASSIKTIELTRTPGEWDNTPAGPNCALLMGYSDVRQNIEKILKTVEEIVFPRSSKTWHLVNTFVSSNSNDARRMDFAMQTWHTLYSKGWIACHVPDHLMPRSSRDIGDSRRLPFIKDLITYAVNKASNNDVIVVTNNDTCLVSTLPYELEAPMARYGCAWANRYDFDKLDQPLTKEQVKHGRWYCGLDLFAFTKEWWLKWSSKYPDMILGCEAWDYIMSQLMVLSISDGGNANLQGCIYHEKHDSFWERSNNRTTNPGQLWNRKLAYEWLCKWKSRDEAMGSFPEQIAHPFKQPHNASGMIVANGKEFVPSQNGTSHTPYVTGSDSTAVAHNSHVTVAVLPPAVPQTQGGPVTRAQTVQKLKATLRTPDGSRVHLFSQANEIGG